MFTYNHQNVILRLLQTFPSVTELVTDPKTINDLCNNGPTQAQPLFFPRLHTLEVRPAHDEHRGLTASHLQAACNFVEQRAALGSPVSFLDIRDLTSYVYDGSNEEVEKCMKKIDGGVVKVRWGPKVHPSNLRQQT
ncbi:hypothetical protein D9613_011889 [Agrocybe pediades]|uniref:Uncharacterized protein n=1 Tax=Agrocybe pediades TaxID=84607 RepID=A0A8H4VLQ4_9AGAR|nr:hypothetical protein D9613_011889 [Agrocybe pediades]